MNEFTEAFHSTFTVLEPSGSGAVGDPGGALSGIGWHLVRSVCRLFCQDTGLIMSPLSAECWGVLEIEHTR